MAGGLQNAWVTDVQVDEGALTITISARFAAMPSPVELDTLSERLKADYGLRGAVILADYPRPKHTSFQAGPGGGAPKGDVILGRAIKQHPVPMDTLTMESGKVTVEGDVVANTSRDTRGGGKVLAFDLTDYSNSISVSRFFSSESRLFRYKACLL